MISMPEYSVEQSFYSLNPDQEDKTMQLPVYVYLLTRVQTFSCSHQ